MRSVLAKSSLLSFSLTQAVVHRFEKERKTEANFLHSRLLPSAKPRAVVCKEDGTGVLLAGGPDKWLHPVLPTEVVEPFLKASLTEAVYVGEDTAHARNVFVVGAKEVESEYAALREWVSPLSVFPSLDAADQSLLSLALSMKQWASLTSFCCRCGGAMTSPDFGLTRQCAQCKYHAYPPVTPAMIVAVLDGKGNVIMSERRQSNVTAATAKPRLTILAGFVAQGESMEETVVREVQEETGAHVTSLRYVGSQPWPFPYQLMTCYYAVADNSPSLTAEQKELVQVRWVPKAEVRQMLEGQHPQFVTSPPCTSTYPLLKAWVDGMVDDAGRPASHC